VRSRVAGDEQVRQQFDHVGRAQLARDLGSGGLVSPWRSVTDISIQSAGSRGGSNFMADHVQNQVRFRGISPSYAFVAERETNRVLERLCRTLKAQVIHGRAFQTIDEVRNAVPEFVACYNTEWLIEKNGFRSPLGARAARLDTNLRRAA
jgi:transposase InsO family protein